MAWNEAVVTTAGMELLARCLTGGNVVISRAVGGESVSAALSLMALKSIKEPCHEMNLFRIENEGGRIIVNLRVQNKELLEEYTLRQIGLFARLDDEESDVLFAVIQDSIGEVIPRESDNPEFLTEFDFVIPVANSEKIQVEITPNTFATAEDIAKAEKELEGHISDKGNPHNVTKAQVGLGNVPNVATNDQTVTYTVAANLGELASGEKLSIAFGKLAKAVKSLIEHIGDSVKHITAAERTAWNGKAAGNHTHTAAEVGALTDIKIGTVTTGAAGSGTSASASTSGTVTTLNLVIPKGDTRAKGATGAQGAQGAKGDKGDKGDTGAAGAAGAKGATGATGTRGSRWTVGTAVTGNSSAATVFSGTGITDALVNDMYLNSSTGYVYKCTVAGAAAGFGTPTATVDGNVGTPSVTVTASGANTAKVFDFVLKILGEQQALRDRRAYREQKEIQVQREIRATPE